MDPWNKIESPGINPFIYGQLIYSKGERNMQRRKVNVFNKCAGQTGQLHVEEVKTLSNIMYKSKLKMD